MSRVVFWWSYGSTSTMATDIGIQKLLDAGDKREIVIACITLQDEHEDNHRVIAPQYSKYFKDKYGVGITYLTRNKFAGESGHGSVDEVFKKRKYMSGVRGASCTSFLKKYVRKKFQREGDCHVFGFHADEAHREGQVIDAEPEIDIWCPLIEDGLNKQDALTHVSKMGLEIPTMYQLGYNNNNCIGCVKADGAGYWNKIRVDFPEVFERRSAQEVYCGNIALVRMSSNVMAKKHTAYFIKMLEAQQNGEYTVKIDTKGRMRVPLRFLPPEAGDHKTEHTWDCGIFCELDDAKNKNIKEELMQEA